MKEFDIHNKKILYIGPASVYYDKSLIKKLEQRGATVTAHDLSNFFPSSVMFRIKVRLTPKSRETIYNECKEKFYKDILKDNGYDYVLVRHGYQLDTHFFDELKAANPNAVFIGFHWDSLRPDYNYLHIMKYFDKVFSFDVKDCREHAGINYLPLFYLDIYKEFRKTSFDNFKQKKNDLLFIGAWRDYERYNLIMRTEALCKKAGLRFEHYLYFPLIRHITSLKHGIIARKSKLKELSHEQILEMFANTNTMIDFPSTFQTGMTIRTFETLGSGRKLITTNQNIVNEPFYDPQYIRVISMKDFELDVDFIKSVPTTSIEEKIQDYSLDSYVTKLFT